MVLPQFAHDTYLVVEFWVNEQSPVFVAGGRYGGLTSMWERK